MASAIYPKYKTALMSASANVSLTGTGADAPTVALIDTGAAPGGYDAADEFYSTVSAGAVGTPGAITTPTVGTVSAGTFDGDNVTYTAVTGATCEALIIFRSNGGANTTWRLVAFLDDANVTGLPVTPNGGDIVISWNASGIFTL